MRGISCPVVSVNVAVDGSAVHVSLCLPFPFDVDGDQWEVGTREGRTGESLQTLPTLKP